MLYKLALIGFGAANMLFLAYVASAKPKMLEDIVIIDPELVGGALQSQWAEVRSNTTYQQFIDALKRFTATAAFATEASKKYPLDEPTPLHVSITKTLKVTFSAEGVWGTVCLP